MVVAISASHPAVLHCNELLWWCVPADAAEGEAAALKHLFEQEKQLRTRNSLLVRQTAVLQSITLLKGGNFSSYCDSPLLHSVTSSVQTAANQQLQKCSTTSVAGL